MRPGVVHVGQGRIAPRSGLWQHGEARPPAAPIHRKNSQMNDLVYPRERTLGKLTLVLGILAWIALIVGTGGVALAALLAGFVVYLFLHSALISHIKGNGVQLTEAQFPELHAQFAACCDRLELRRRPQAYVLNGGGTLNAFATKFLGTQYVVLLSGAVEAM